MKVLTIKQNWTTLIMKCDKRLSKYMKIGGWKWKSIKEE